MIVSELRSVARRLVKARIPVCVQKRPLRRHRTRLEDSIKVDIKEIETILTEFMQLSIVSGGSLL